MEMNDFDKYFMSLAMCSLAYCEILSLEQKKVTDTLGNLLCLYKDELINLSPRELALFVVYICDIKEENYLEYIGIFKDKLIIVLELENEIKEQIKLLSKLEDIYFEFDLKASDFVLSNSFIEGLCEKNVSF